MAAVTAQELSDATLDAAFAASWDLSDYATAQYYGDEIRTRLQTVGMFWTGLLGHSSFPLYEARSSGYSQTVSAKDSVNIAVAQLPQNAVDTVGNAASAIGSAVQNIASGAASAIKTPAMYIGAGLFVLAAFYIYTKSKK